MNMTIPTTILLLAILTVFAGCNPAADDGEKKTETQSQTQTGTQDQQQIDSAGSTELVQHGTLREAIGEQQHQGRVKFADLIDQPHFYGVAALAELKGEAAIVDSELTVSVVDDEGKLTPVGENADQMQATVLIGGYVDGWHEMEVDRDVSADEFDDFIAASAESQQVNPDQPFVFAVEGEFSDVHLHVINGACPVHARMQKHELADEQKPFEMTAPDVSGTLVGVYARNAVGKLTQPANDTHRHLVFADEANQKQVGHVEQGGIRKGAKLRIAK